MYHTLQSQRDCGSWTPDYRVVGVLICSYLLLVKLCKANTCFSVFRNVISGSGKLKRGAY